MEPATNYLLVIPSADMATRLLLAFAFGALVGIERRWHHKNAGIQTHALVSVGAAAFGMLSILGFGPTNNPMLIAAGVVSGIGFIGGGVIMRRGASVQGINTAANLWATSSMGLALGPGYYSLAALILLVILTIQFPLRWLEHAIARKFPGEPERSTYHLVVRMNPSAADSASAAWDAFTKRSAAVVQSMTSKRDGDTLLLEAEFSISDADARELSALHNVIASVPAVERVQLERIPAGGNSGDQ